MLIKLTKQNKSAFFEPIYKKCAIIIIGGGKEHGKH